MFQDRHTRPDRALAPLLRMPTLSAVPYLKECNDGWKELHSDSTSYASEAAATEDY